MKKIFIPVLMISGLMLAAQGYTHQGKRINPLYDAATRLHHKKKDGIINHEAYESRSLHYKKNSVYKSTHETNESRHHKKGGSHNNWWAPTNLTDETLKAKSIILGIPLSEMADSSTGQSLANSLQDLFSQNSNMEEFASSGSTSQGETLEGIYGNIETFDDLEQVVKSLIGQAGHGGILAQLQVNSGCTTNCVELSAFKVEVGENTPASQVQITRSELDSLTDIYEKLLKRLSDPVGLNLNPPSGQTAQAQLDALKHYIHELESHMDSSTNSLKNEWTYYDEITDIPDIIPTYINVDPAHPQTMVKISDLTDTSGIDFNTLTPDQLSNLAPTAFQGLTEDQLKTILTLKTGIKLSDFTKDQLEQIPPARFRKGDFIATGLTPMQVQSLAKRLTSDQLDMVLDPTNGLIDPSEPLSGIKLADLNLESVKNMKNPNILTGLIQRENPGSTITGQDLQDKLKDDSSLSIGTAIQDLTKPKTPHIKDLLAENTLAGWTDSKLDQAYKEIDNLQDLQTFIQAQIKKIDELKIGDQGNHKLSDLLDSSKRASVKLSPAHMHALNQIVENIEKKLKEFQANGQTITNSQVETVLKDMDTHISTLVDTINIANNFEPTHMDKIPPLFFGGITAQQFTKLITDKTIEKIKLSQLQEVPTSIIQGISDKTIVHLPPEKVQTLFHLHKLTQHQNDIIEQALLQDLTEAKKSGSSQKISQATQALIDAGFSTGGNTISKTLIAHGYTQMEKLLAEHNLGGWTKDKLQSVYEEIHTLKDLRTFIDEQIQHLPSLKVGTQGVHKVGDLLDASTQDSVKLTARDIQGLEHIYTALEDHINGLSLSRSDTKIVQTDQQKMEQHLDEIVDHIDPVKNFDNSERIKVSQTPIKDDSKLKLIVTEAKLVDAEVSLKATPTDPKATHDLGQAVGDYVTTVKDLLVKSPDNKKLETALEEGHLIAEEVALEGTSVSGRLKIALAEAKLVSAKQNLVNDPTNVHLKIDVAKSAGAYLQIATSALKSASQDTDLKTLVGVATDELKEILKQVPAEVFFSVSSDELQHITGTTNHQDALAEIPTQAFTGASEQELQTITQSANLDEAKSKLNSEQLSEFMRSRYLVSEEHPPKPDPHKLKPLVESNHFILPDLQSYAQVPKIIPKSDLDRVPKESFLGLSQSDLKAITGKSDLHQSIETILPSQGDLFNMYYRPPDIPEKATKMDLKHTEITEITSEDIKKMDNSHIANLSIAQISQLHADVFTELTEKQIDSLSKEQKHAIDDVFMEESLKSLTRKQFLTLTDKQIKSIPIGIISQVPADKIALISHKLTQDQLHAVLDETLATAYVDLATIQQMGWRGDLPHNAQKKVESAQQALKNDGFTPKITGKTPLEKLTEKLTLAQEAKEKAKNSPHKTKQVILDIALLNVQLLQTQLEDDPTNETLKDNLNTQKNLVNKAISQLKRDVKNNPSYYKDKPPHYDVEVALNLYQVDPTKPYSHPNKSSSHPDSPQKNLDISYEKADQKDTHQMFCILTNGDIKLVESFEDCHKFQLQRHQPSYTIKTLRGRIYHSAKNG